MTNSFFEPSPFVLAWLVTRKFVWPELILLLALARLALGPGGARLPALGAALISGAVVLTIFAPALGMAEGGAYATALAAGNHAQGLTALLVPSLLLLLCARWRFRPARGIEIFTFVITLGGLALWTATQI